MIAGSPKQCALGGVILAGLIPLLNAATLPVERYLDRSVLAVVRINEVRDMLRRECAVPTVTRPGSGGGAIDHQYEMAQCITRLERIVNYYDDKAQCWTNDTVALEYVRRVEAEESLPEIKEAFTIVLGYCGIPSKELVAIARRTARREISRHGIQSIINADMKEAIPDLFDLLTDASESSLGAQDVGGGETEYPIRTAAAFALRKFEVEVERLPDGTHHGDRNRAVDVLERALQSCGPGRASDLLTAVGRMGGEPSRKVLRDYVKSNQADAKMAQSVSLAKELLKGNVP